MTELVKLLPRRLIPRNIPDREELESMGKAEAPGYTGRWRKTAYGQYESSQSARKRNKR